MEMAYSTISAILKEKDRVKEAVKASTDFNAIITRQQKGLIRKMEKLLTIWFDDQIQKRMPMSLLIIQTKPCSIFAMLKVWGEEELTETFTANRGWLQSFHCWFNLHNRAVSGESVSAGVKGAEKFVEDFYKIIEDGSYCSEQIFNMDETGLFGKKMPGRSYIHKEAKSYA